MLAKIFIIIILQLIVNILKNSNARRIITNAELVLENLSTIHELSEKIKLKNYVRHIQIRNSTFKFDDTSSIFDGFNLNLLEFIDVQFQSKITINLLKNARIDHIIFERCNFSNSMYYMNENKDEDNFESINSTIEILRFISIKNGFEENFLSKKLFENMEQIIFDQTYVKNISDDFTSYFKKRPIYIFYEPSMSGSFKWLNKINIEHPFNYSRCTNDGNCLINGESNETFVNIFNKYGIYLFPLSNMGHYWWHNEDYLCRFKYFPHTQLVIPFPVLLKSYCSCVIYWVFQNAQKYWSILKNHRYSTMYPRTLPFLSKCLNDTNFTKIAQECDFQTRFSVCEQDNVQIHQQKDHIKFDTTDKTSLIIANKTTIYDVKFDSRYKNITIYNSRLYFYPKYTFDYTSYIFHSANLRNLTFINVDFINNIPAGIFGEVNLDVLTFDKCKFNDKPVYDTYNQETLLDGVKINSIYFQDIKSGFKDTFISKNILKFTQKIHFNRTPILSLNDDFTSHFKKRPLTIIYSGLDMNSSFYWLRNLNKEYLIDYTNSSLNEKLLNENAIYLEFKGDFLINDDYFCLFKYFPHKHLVIPRIITHNLSCSCTLYWIFKNFIYYKNSFEETDQSMKLISICFAFENVSTIISKCNFDNRLSLCNSFQASNVKLKQNGISFTVADNSTNILIENNTLDSNMKFIYRIFHGINISILKFKNVFFRSRVPARLFADCEIEMLIFENCSFSDDNASYSDSLNEDNLNIKINSVEIKSFKNIFNENFISSNLFNSMKSIRFSNTTVSNMSMKFLTSFQKRPLRVIYEGIDRNVPLIWFQNLNIGVNVESDNIDDTTFIRLFHKHVIYAIIEDDKPIFFDDSYFCVFRHFPRNQLVIPMYQSSKTHAIVCTCLIFWLYGSILNHREYLLSLNETNYYTKDILKTCFNASEVAIISAKCEFQKLRSECQDNKKDSSNNSLSTTQSPTTLSLNTTFHFLYSIVEFDTWNSKSITMRVNSNSTLNSRLSGTLKIDRTKDSTINQHLWVIMTVAIFIPLLLFYLNKRK